MRLKSSMDSTADMGDRPLSGMRMLDLTGALAGPYATMILGGLGAEVIHIEAPGGRDMARESVPYMGPRGLNFSPRQDDEMSLSLLNRKRNKQSISLNLKDARGRALFMKLAAKADAIVENMSEGAPSRLGISYEDVAKINPALVYASIRAFGEPSEYPDLKGVDIIVQALSGVMEVTGFADGPPTRFGLPIADMLAPLYAVQGVLAALLHRQRTGQGQHIVVSMLDCVASLMAIENFDMLIGKAGYPMRSGNSTDRMAPFGVYETADGHVAIAAGRNNWFPWLMQAIGQPELARDPRFETRAERTRNAQEINKIITNWTKTHSSDEVIEIVHRQYRVPTALVRTPLQMLADPSLMKSGALVELEHPKYGKVGAIGTGLPIQFSKTPCQFDRPALELGASNDAVFGELLGLSQDERRDLVSLGII